MLERSRSRLAGICIQHSTHKDSPQRRTLRAHLKYRVDIAKRRQSTYKNLMLELTGQKKPGAKTYLK